MPASSKSGKAAKSVAEAPGALVAHAILIDMKQVDEITLSELAEMALSMYGALVKGVVDIDKRILVLDAELHADEEQFLLENGSQQMDLWGILSGTVLKR